MHAALRLEAAVRTSARRLLSSAGLAALLLCGGCAGPDLGPSRGTRGPWWVPDPVLSAAVGAARDTRTHHAQKQAQRPVHFTARGEQEALLRAAAAVLRTQGFELRPRLGGEPLHTVRRDAGLPYGTVGSRPAVLARSYVLSAAPASAKAAPASHWALTLRVEVERCVAADPEQLELRRTCAPLSDVSPDLQRELEALGGALRDALADGTDAAAR